MRKLFNIDQDEKNRILEMHENATKRHYLNETGVAFAGGEPNGFKINKMETKEQQENQSKTFSPENVKKISDMATQLFNRGDKDGFFTIDTLPTLMFQLTSTNTDTLSLGTNELQVWVGFPGVPLVVRNFGALSINLESGVKIGGQKLIPGFTANSDAMAPIQKEPEAIMAAKNFGDAFGTVFPKDVTSKVLINTYKTMTEQNKNNFMAFLQRTNPELNTYKQMIKSTLGLA
jgi:hypothetical protein